MKKRLIEEKNNIVSFSLYKVKKGMQKFCKCNPPHYEIDEVNRIVMCTDCGAVVDSFDALLTLCKYFEEYEKFQEEAVKKINTYKQLAEKENRRRIKNKIFKEMDRNYKDGLFPACPKCGKLFNPAEIKEWTNKRFYREDKL